MNQSEVRVQLQKALRKACLLHKPSSSDGKHHKEKSIQNFGYKCIICKDFLRYVFAAKGSISEYTKSLNLQQCPLLSLHQSQALKAQSPE